MVYVFGFLFPVDSTVYHLFGGWRYFWMDGGNHLCIHFRIVVFLLCIDGWHIILTVIFFIYAFMFYLLYLDLDYLLYLDLDLYSVLWTYDVLCVTALCVCVFGF